MHGAEREEGAVAWSGAEMRGSAMAQAVPGNRPRGYPRGVGSGVIPH